MKLHHFCMWIIFCMTSFIVTAQESEFTFNKIKPADFSLTNITVDTSEGAVIIADVGKSYFEGNSKGWFSLIYQHKRRIRIIDKKGFDLASVDIPLYRSKTSNSEEILESLKASTYNLENGKVVETKLDKETVFKEKADENHLIRKFTMPAVKEGSIIEYSYTVNSDFLFTMQPWRFQGGYPRVWSEYQVSIPFYFQYAFLSQGYLKIDKTVKNVNSTYLVRQANTGGEKDDFYNMKTEDKVTRWVSRNVPAMKEESFTSSIENHIAKVEFQLAAHNFPDQPYKNIMGDWRTVSKELMDDKEFGADLAFSNNWIESDLKNATAGSENKLQEAMNIYKFIQKSIKSKGTRGIYLSQTLKETYKNKNGYVPDVNLLLALALHNRGFDVSPVIMSTRANGYTSDLYPLLNKYNYVICRLMLDNVYYYLDASVPYLGFDKRPSYLNNGAAQVINTNSTTEYFSADTATEMKLTQVFLLNDPANTKNWKGSLSSLLGYDESTNYREDILVKGKDAFDKKIIDSYTGDFKAQNIEITDLAQQEQPLQVKYSIEIDNNNADIIYFNPMLKEGMNTNVFKSLNRQYPVEMPYKIYETYLLKVQIPEGYVIDELPKSVRSNYNGNEAMFEYLVSKSATEINMRTVIKFEKALFPSEDYESLRSFFDLIVKKHAEQIVFKKK